MVYKNHLGLLGLGATIQESENHQGWRRPSGLSCPTVKPAPPKLLLNQSQEPHPDNS